MCIGTRRDRKPGARVRRGVGACRGKGSRQVKAREIVLIGMLFFAGFILSEFIIEHMMFANAYQRFLARVIFYAQFWLILYLLFAVWDTQKRIRWMEVLWSRERRLRLRNRLAGLTSKTGFARKGLHGRDKTG